jgi:hypothetical protein
MPALYCAPLAFLHELRGRVECVRHTMTHAAGFPGLAKFWRSMQRARGAFRLNLGSQLFRGTHRDYVDAALPCVATADQFPALAVQQSANGIYERIFVQLVCESSSMLGTIAERPNELSSRRGFQFSRALFQGSHLKTNLLAAEHTVHIY